MFCDSRFESQITIAIKPRDLEHLAKDSKPYGLFSFSADLRLTLSARNSQINLVSCHLVNPTFYPLRHAIFPTRYREKAIFKEKPSPKAIFTLPRAKNRMSQGVQNRGSQMSVPLAICFIFQDLGISSRTKPGNSEFTLRAFSGTRVAIPSASHRGAKVGDP